ncbi:choline/carnitine O-acyltransferase [Enterococcus sp. LJL51]|uniref:choline/carnitine O-acyltransferase n=1 Tax=Enterococcus sp. LJL51 TaxID=3416656 RepID=UPI003CEB6EE6
MEKLPVPDLEDTLVELFNWASPFITAEESKELSRSLEEFSEGTGRVLQERLLKHQQNSSGSWLASFWQDSYLSGRGPVQSESNFALVPSLSSYQHIT